MNMFSNFVCGFFMLGAVTVVLGQRPFFAGTKPIGYPALEKPPGGLEDRGNGQVTTIVEAMVDEINRFLEAASRFGEVNGTTQKLPLEANGDYELIDRLSKLPVDKQPFWFINWQALEKHRENPQTYPQKPNPFLEPVNLNQNIAPSSPSQTNSNSDSAASNSGLGNRFGDFISTTAAVSPSTSKPAATISATSVYATTKTSASSSSGSQLTTPKPSTSTLPTSKSKVSSSDFIGSDFKDSAKKILESSNAKVDGQTFNKSNNTKVSNFLAYF